MSVRIPDRPSCRWVLRAARKASHSGIHLRLQAHQAGQHQSLVPRAQARRYRGLSLARSATHVGELARAGRYAAFRVTGARRMGNGEDGAPLRASRRGAPGRLCRQHGRSRHGCGTTSGFPRHSPITSFRKLMRFMVARDRIELPTRGFLSPLLIPIEPLHRRSRLGPAVVSGTGPIALTHQWLQRCSRFG